MLLKYFYDKALAHASYLVGCQKTGEAIIIDPDRHIDHYIEAAKREQMTIVGTAETHIHADYVSGSRELAEKVGARIYVSDEGPADWKYTYLKDYDHKLLKQGDSIAIGNIKLDVVHTPGHTPESISFILTDLGGGANKPMGMFTGDFVFVGSTGRPDLLEEAAGQVGTAEPGARDLYRSIQEFKQLPDYLQIWPSHGAGSACGKGLGAVPSSTVGYEKMFNSSLQFETEDEFVDFILSDQPEAPKYFARMKHVNKHGPKIVADSDLPLKLNTDQLTNVVANNMVIDVGASSNFAERHVAGTLNFPIKYLASQSGWMIDYEKPLYLIASSTTLTESVRILREIGVDNIAGYFDFDEIVAAKLANESFGNSEPNELRSKIENGVVMLFDVRRQAEWNEGHVPQATHRFLGSFGELTDLQGNEKPIVCICRTGARSAIACSLLQSAGIKNVINLKGGIEKWRNDGLPIVTQHAQAVS